MEATVDRDAVVNLATHPATRDVGGLEDHDRTSALREAASGREPGDPGSDDDDIDIDGAHGVSLLARGGLVEVTASILPVWGESRTSVAVDDSSGASVYACTLAA